MINIIAAVARNRAIGFQNKLIYWLPNDLKRFKALTTGNTIIMGRKTFESLPKGALPNRRNVVLSRTVTELPGCDVYPSLEDALQHCNADEDIYIIGGDSVYSQAMPLADRLCLTEIDDTPKDADAFFPDYTEGWRVESKEAHETDEKHAHRYAFVDYVRAVVVAIMMMFALNVSAQDKTTVAADKDSVAPTVVDDELLSDGEVSEMDAMTGEEIADAGIYSQLKTKFVEGGVGFMTLVALVLIIGLTICIERIIYLSMSEIDAKKLMLEIEKKLDEEGEEAAKELCRNTRGPVASICYQGLLRMHEGVDEIERSISSYASVQIGNMEKGCSWITLLIAMAPSLGFLGTVIGMVLAFDNIQAHEDINPTIVASGMKVALITTIFGIITALILQLFYNYVLSKIDHLTAQMEESAITLIDILKKK